MHTVQMTWSGDPHALRRAPLRYALLDRLARTAHKRDLSLLAFGIGEHEIRLVIDGPFVPVDRAINAVRSGTQLTADARRAHLAWGCREIRAVRPHRAVRAIGWAHQVGPDPSLSHPWTSHRDWLGLRQAPFFQPRAPQRFPRAKIHRASGGGPLPHTPTAPPPRCPCPPLRQLLQISGAVYGTVPADSRCFRLYTHLTRHFGVGTQDIARSLNLSRRRIDQLFRQPEPMVPAALAHLLDPRLTPLP